MKTMPSSVVSLLLVASSLVLAVPLFADPVQHHGAAVDPEGSAEYCIGCHDGALANTVSFCTVACGFGTSHSILKPYPPPGKEMKYAPEALVVAKGLRIVDGKVTCISCHNLKNPKKDHLAVDNTGSRLCRTCHIKP